MLINKEHLSELLSRKTYMRFVLAFDYKKTVSDIVNGIVGDKIIERIKQNHIDIYNDYDSSSFMINDFLQSTVCSVLRENIQIPKYLKDENKEDIYQSRIIRNCIKEYGRNKNIVIGEEISSMFSWFCKYNHNSWFDSFIPVEMHMGGYSWIDDLENKWINFME